MKRLFTKFNDCGFIRHGEERQVDLSRAASDGRHGREAIVDSVTCDERVALNKQLMGHSTTRNEREDSQVASFVSPESDQQKQDRSMMVRFTCKWYLCSAFLLGSPNSHVLIRSKQKEADKEDDSSVARKEGDPSSASDPNDEPMLTSVGSAVPVKIPTVRASALQNNKIPDVSLI
jgi:hypothetical protein